MGNTADVPLEGQAILDGCRFARQLSAVTAIVEGDQRAGLSNRIVCRPR